MKNNTKQKQTANSLPYYHNPNSTMKEVFQNIQIHLPKDYKFDREFANGK